MIRQQKEFALDSDNSVETSNEDDSDRCKDLLAPINEYSKSLILGVAKPPKEDDQE